MIENEKPVTDAPPDITPIRRLIRQTLRLLRSSWVATGLGLTVGLALGTLVVVALFDLALPLWSAFRLIALILVVVPTVWVFAMGVVRPLVRRLGPRQVARRIERHIPGIHNRLVSCIDLEDGGRKTVRSPEFYRRLVQEALERIRGFRARTVVDFRSLRRAGLLAGVSTLAFGLALGLFSDRLPTALARIFSPFADIPPASGVLYTVEPGDAKALRGEDLLFNVRVEQGNPERLQLELSADATAEPLRYDLLKVNPKLWTFTLSGFEKSFQYRVRGGGTWSRLKRITMIDRPKLVGLHTVLHFPDYMGMPEPRVGPPQVADVTGPKDSAVEVVVQVDGDVSEGEIQLLDSRPVAVEVKERPERIWFQERYPDGAAPGGRWDWDFRLLARPAHTEPPAAGIHEHLFQNAPVPFPVRSGESLFALVYINPEQKPDAIMLQWFDGASWEHRSYWGADKFAQGKPNSPSRRRVGPLPTAGEWVRLEVPAAQVDLAGKTVRGMAFTLSGGQCFWHRSGTVAPRSQELIVATKFPMQSAGQGHWSGRFPLDHDALFRVELRNELGYPNKTMKQGRAVAIPDNPPQVVLERPGTDLVLSEPIKVPLTVAAFDDFGLASIDVAVQRGDSGGFVGHPIHRFNRPKRSANLTESLDLTTMDLKPGDHVRYRVEARDRKGQSAQTKEYVIRISNDNAAADKALATFEKEQDTFRENLTKLIAEQSKVQEAVTAMTAKYAPLEEKIEAAQAKAEARPAPEGAPKVPDPAQAKAAPPPPLDPETAKELAELRQELAQMAAKEEQNAQLGQQVAAGLKAAAEKAPNLQMLPTPMLDQIKEVQQAFQERALQPLQNLAGEMKAGAAADKPAPDLAQMHQEADRLQKELEAVRAQLEASAKAREALPEGAAEALTQLRNEMLRQNAGLTARDLDELREFLKTRAEELKRLQGQQEQLAEATPVVPDVMVPDIEKRQGELDVKEAQRLEEARRLLDAEKLRKMRRQDPDFPKMPYHPEADEERVPPKEEDPDDPADAKAKDAAKKKADPSAKKDEAEPHDDEPELFMPALGGPKPKLDPRFADKLRPVAPHESKGEEADAHHGHREELMSRQRQRLQELDTARQSLTSDKHTLDDLFHELEQALHNQDPEAAQQLLDQLMQSPTMQQALAMAARRHQGPPHAPNQAASAPHPGESTKPQKASINGSPLNAELADLDLATRTVILKMQPKLREELLQGLREEGPEGYRAFIRDYFQRLTKVKGAP